MMRMPRSCVLERTRNVEKHKKTQVVLSSRPKTRTRRNHNKGMERNMNISITDSQGEWLLEILEREMFPDQMEQLMIEASMDAFKDEPQAFEIAPGDTVTGYLDPADPEVAKAKWLGLALDTRIEYIIDFFGPKEPDGKPDAPIDERAEAMREY